MVNKYSSLSIYSLLFVGDYEYKPYVIATPDIKEVPLSGHEDFLILGCDGLWDFLTEQKVAWMVYNMIAANPGK